MKENSDIARFLAELPFPLRAEMDRSVIAFDWGDWYGVDMFEGFCGVTKNVITFHADPKFRELFAIGYYIGPKPTREGQVEIFRGASGLNVYRNPGEHKRVWSVHDVFRVPDEKDVIPALYRPGFDRRRQAFLLGPAPKLEACGEPDEVRLISKSAGRLAIEASMKCRGMVVIGDTYSPGWKATIDGKPSPVLEVYSAIRGVVVDAGSHRIEMHYSPMSVWIGAAMTALGLLGALLLRWLRI